MHVPASTFQKILKIAADVGFQQSEQQPQVRCCRAVVFENGDSAAQSDS
jgi:hypothetical protein